MFAQIKSTFKLVISLLTLAAFIYVIFFVATNIMAFEYSAEKVVQKYVALAESPANVLTEADKAQLQEITQGQNILFYNQTEAELLDLRKKFVQGNKIQIGGINYLGANKSVAESTLNFNNNLKNPNGKAAKLNLQKTGNIWLGGEKWKIYQIDMPEEDNLLNNAGENIKEGSQNILDNILKPFQPNQNNNQ